MQSVFCLTPESTPELSKCVTDPHCLWVKFCKSSPNFQGWRINKQQILNLPSQHVIHSSNFNCLLGPGISRSYQDLTCLIHGTWNQTSTGDKGVGFHETRKKKGPCYIGQYFIPEIEITHVPKHIQYTPVNMAMDFWRLCASYYWKHIPLLS